ncbi:MAG TPA: choice-of-anchor tandem repeat GloVer-containing protein, partial [Verrucomicrobiae bacterium]|nr:choice-of-anchor tandem repeat GloVer-containing protein [Verrucomicrobiae bacterium]
MLLGRALGISAVILVAPLAYGDIAINTLISFNLANGNQPSAGLVQGPDGAFYGTTQTGGSYNQGTVFKITSSGAFTSLLSFTGTNGLYPGANPVGNLVLGANGNLYGITEAGGTSDLGTVFVVATNGTFTSLISFTGTNGPDLGDYPTAGLVWGTNGNLYGATEYGGTNDPANGGDGTLFEVATNGVFNNLVSFTAINGAYPVANSLVPGTDGNLYGTTQYGGTNDLINGGDGTVFRITSAGAFTTLASF